MKKILFFCLSLVMIFSSLTACHSTTEDPPKESSTEEVSTTSDITDELPTETTTPASTDELPTEGQTEDFEYRIFDLDSEPFTLENEVYDLKGLITIRKYIGSDPHVVIPDTINNIPVALISGNAFTDTAVETITIGDNVQLTGNHAFEGATSLVKVRGGASLRRIGEYAFHNCPSLERVDLSSDSMKVIGKEAFNGCEKLVEAKLGSNITTIGDYAFANCTALQSVNLPKSLIYWGFYTFAGNSSLSELTIEDGLTVLWGSAFVKCNALTSIVIPASVTRMDGFYYSGLTEVTFLGEEPFCDDFNSIFPENVTIYYNPQAEGWESTMLRDKYTLLPLEE